MKTCAICHTENGPDAETCVACGEASWMPAVEPVEPESIPGEPVGADAGADKGAGGGRKKGR